MEILDEKIIEDIMNEVLYYTEGKSNILNSDNIEIAEKELKNSIEVLNRLKVVFNEKINILNLFISLGKVKEDGEGNIPQRLFFPKREEPSRRILAVNR